MHPETNRCELAEGGELELYVKLTLRRRPAEFEARTKLNQIEVLSI